MGKKNINVAGKAAAELLQEQRLNDENWFEGIHEVLISC